MACLKAIRYPTEKEKLKVIPHTSTVIFNWFEKINILFFIFKILVNVHFTKVETLLSLEII
jgi:hypothetical protein